MGKQNRETREVQNPALLEVGCRPDVLVWRQITGKFRAMDNPERVVSVGTAGISDSVMVVATKITAEMVGKTVGIACFPEFKTAKGPQREAQERWQAAVEKRGCIYRLIKSPAEMVALVEDIQNGRW